jgi:hypothetical protein
MVKVGGIEGKNEYNSDGDYEYAVVAHGFDDENSAYEANYDEIDDDIRRNRWHVQSHFETLPKNEHYGTRGGQMPDFVNYNVFNPRSTNVTDFEKWEPDEADLDSGTSYEFSATISVDIVPFFSLDMTEGYDPSDGGYVEKDDYENLKFHIQLDGTSDLPSREDDARIGRFDVFTNGNAGETHPVNVYSKFSFYESYTGSSGQFKETNVNQFQATYDVTN